MALLPLIQLVITSIYTLGFAITPKRRAALQVVWKMSAFCFRIASGELNRPQAVSGKAVPVTFQMPPAHVCVMGEILGWPQR